MEQKRMILIVEDEKSLREVLQDKLELSNFEVIVAKNGGEGLSLALEKHPDLILLDLAMPVMSGTVMFEKLQEDDWGKSAKVIVLSNLIDTGKLLKTGIGGRGVYKYIVKTDIKIEELAKEIREMFQ